MGRQQFPINAKIGDVLRKLRISKGLHLSAANEIRKIYGVKLDPSYLSRMERGKAEIPLRTLEAIGQYYSTPLSDIIRLALNEDSIQSDASVLLKNRKLNESFGAISAALGESRAVEIISDYLHEIATVIHEASGETGSVRAASPGMKKRIRKLRY